VVQKKGQNDILHLVWGGTRKYGGVGRKSHKTTSSSAEMKSLIRQEKGKGE